jgi:hypothetical protein
MKNPPLSRPRFHCRLVRLWCPDTGPRPRHVESCADCREYFRASEALDSALRRDAVRSAPEFPAGLERSIMQAVRASGRTPEPSRFSTALFAGGGFIAAAAVALAVVFFHQAPGVKSTAVVAKDAAAVPGIVAAAESLADRWWNEVVPPARTLVMGNPLQQELNSVYSDARSALDFLALNFLPSTRDTAARKSGQVGAEG